MYQFHLVVALEAGARNDVEHAVRAVAIRGRVAAALGLQVVDVFRIDLRADVAGDVGVGDGTPSIAQVTWWPPRMWS